MALPENSGGSDILHQERREVNATFQQNYLSQGPANRQYVQSINQSINQWRCTHQTLAEIRDVDKS